MPKLRVIICRRSLFLALLDFFEKVKLKNRNFGLLDICRGAFFQRKATCEHLRVIFKGDVYKTMKDDHPRYKNDSLTAHTYLMT